LDRPQPIDDPLTEVAREGASRMLAQVLIAKADFRRHVEKDIKLRDGRKRSFSAADDRRRKHSTVT